MENIKVTCPDCGCDNILIRKKGTNKIQAILGVTLLCVPHPIAKIVGLFTGISAVSDRNKVECSCANCGKTWFAGEYKTSDSNQKPKDKTNEETEVPNEKTDIDKEK